MADNNTRGFRSRDDDHLHRLAAETQAWMEAEGIAEQPLDWQDLARQERTRWWRERLRAAVTDLTARMGELPAAVAATLRGLGEAAEVGAEAALGVTLDAVARVGRIVPETDLSAGPLDFTPALPGVKGRAEAREAGMGVVVTPGLPGARVTVDAVAGTVLVELLGVTAPLVVMLVPEDPALPPLVKEAEAVGGSSRVCFDNVVAGGYLLTLHPTQGGEKP
jgi:hypothetical protein